MSEWKCIQCGRLLTAHEAMLKNCANCGPTTIYDGDTGTYHDEPESDEDEDNEDDDWQINPRCDPW